MTAAGKTFETFAHAVTRGCLGKNSAAAGDNRICRKNKGRLSRPSVRDSLRLQDRQPERVRARQFVFQRNFVDAGRTDCVWYDSGLCKQRTAARALAGKDETKTMLI
jgi:hypothetical protein